MDTLEHARTKAYAKDFAEADRLLTAYNATRATVDGLRLQAQVLYWDKQFARAAAVHGRAIDAFPDQPVLKLDYARLLYETGQLPLAQQLLRDFVAHDSQHAEANLLLAQIGYQNLRPTTARRDLAALLTAYPGNAVATALLKDINQATSPYFKVSSSYASDDQPLQTLALRAEAAWFQSWLLSPTVQLQANSFELPDTQVPYRSTWFQAGNKVSLLRAGLGVSVTAGLFQHQPTRTSAATGAVLLTKKLSSQLDVDATVARQPYQFVLASVRQPVFEQVAGAALRYSRSGGWLGKAGYDQRRYGDDNLIQTAYAWLLAPVAASKTASIKSGLSLSYGDAARSTYTAGTASGSLVQARYAPYFTPLNQYVGALLLSLKVSPFQAVDLSTRASLGVLGTADVPYFYLNRRANGPLYLEQGFAAQSYRPVEVHGEVALRASPWFTVTAAYDYANLLFYTSQQVSLQLNYHLVREKNR
ncbi:tetratricopeptide repeat protein [Hymenobacter sp. B1770]|uniref:tetratricopeptide repeat protein n=1 Tax=Hymenobacter sp. B1770 TaxID=1718788 RepID=UPI003CFA8640